MGRKLLPCNLTETEISAAWDEFGEGLLTHEEIESINEILTPYLFYTTLRRGEERECVCTHSNCGKFTVSKRQNPAFFGLKHGNETRCPRCGEIVNLISLGKMRTFDKLNRAYWTKITLCRVAEDGALLLLSGYAMRQFCWGDLRPLPDVNWKAWTYLKPGKRMQWRRTWEPTCQRVDENWWWAYQWNPSETVKEPFQPGFFNYYGGCCEGDSYFVNIEAVAQSSMRYCQVEDWAYKDAGVFLDTGDDPVRNVVKYLSAYTQYPALEMAVKLDLHHAATELVVYGKKNHRDLNWEGRTIHEFLRLNKQDAKAFFSAGGNLPLLKAFHTASKLKVAANMKDFFSVLVGSSCVNNAEKLVTAAVKAKCTVRQAANYIHKFPGGADHVLTTWIDYLNMASVLEYDLDRNDVAMPTDLQERHDAASETVRYQKIMVDEEKYRKYNEHLRKLYSFEYGDLCIVVPGSVEDIIYEGKTLRHCVGGYAARHFEDKLHILFLRHKRKPSTPFITIEITPRKTMMDKLVIKQIHGYRNEMYLRPAEFGTKKNKAKPSVKYKWFLDMWRAWVEAGSRRDKKGNPILPKRKEKTA